MNNTISKRLIELFGEDSIFQFEEIDLVRLNKINPDIKRSLLIEGLPHGAAPEFQFDNDMEVVKEPYISIGDGIDFRPILLNVESGAVFERVGENHLNIINSDLSIFKQCLILYAEMVESAIEENGPKAYLENNIPDKFVAAFNRSVQELDPEIFGIDSFWEVEIRRLLAHLPDN
jgi:hypothetical protein